MGEKQITFLQVLLFRDSEYARELGPALWAALKEVELLYNRGEQRAKFERYYLAEDVPEWVTQGAGFRADKSALAVESAEWWQSLGGWSRSVPLDKERVLTQVRKLLGNKASNAYLLVVTDLEITPPTGWRFIVWDKIDGVGSVASVRPTDPVFWGQEGGDRISTIKRRVRAVCCSIVGETLGFKRCGNPRCFLYGYVARVRHLDDMICIGTEHHDAELVNNGFPLREEDPASVRPVVNLMDSFSRQESNVDPSEFEGLDF